MMKLSFLIVLVSLLVSHTSLSHATGGMDFFDRKAEGWFWYQDPPEPAEEDPVPEPKPEPPPVKRPPPKEPEEVAAPAPTPEPGPVPLSTEWIRETLPKYLDRAIDNPTKDNIAAWLYLQKLSMDKSQRFTDMAQLVVMGDPLLDENTRRPVAGWGAKVANETASKNKREILARLAKETGIWFFYKKDCQHCEAQVYTQRNLNRWHQFETLPITLDGSKINTDDPVFQNPVQDAGQAAMLSIMQYPALYLAKPATGELLLLGQGYFSADQMEQRILMAAHGAGWINGEEYDKTRPMSGPLMDPALESGGQIDDPEVLMNILRESLTIGGGIK